MDDLDYQSLKSKQRQIREGFSEHFGLRVHRAISWVGRAEQDANDQDASFIFYWIAFNAAYARDDQDVLVNEERGLFEDYFVRIISLDAHGRIYNAIWEKFSDSIRVFLDNQYVFQPFWKFQNNIPGYENWAERFERSKKRIRQALQIHDTTVILSILFDRLYVLRNQLIHGGATWNSSVNRSQVQDGAKILAFLVPIFIDVMMDHPDETWGPPYYPVM